MNSMERDLERIKQGLEPLSDGKGFIIETDYPKAKRPKIVVVNDSGLWDDVPLETRKLIKFTLFAWVTGFICASILFTGGIL